jgi:hypothetical protein
MFASSTGWGLDTRPLRVQVPAFADSYLPGVTVSRKAAQSTYKGPRANGVQRPLLRRSRFRQRLRPGVAMTSHVKSGLQLFYVCMMFLSSVHRKSRRQSDPTVAPAAIRGWATT